MTIPPGVRSYSKSCLYANWFEDRVLEEDTEKLKSRGFEIDTSSKLKSSPFVVRQSTEGITSHSVYHDDFSPDRLKPRSTKPPSTDATLSYATHITNTKTRSMKKENQFETTQHDYGKNITFTPLERDCTGEIISTDPAKERVFVMPEAGHSEDAQEFMKTRSMELSGTIEGKPRTNFRRTSYFTQPLEKYTGSKWKDL
ncbi:uncharacterized protein MONOS_11457 [Monocercomonoides exilis]|uniref:uncharacterized protein n=1 Tax=Monocercomonoides exilis TaxID=2049356 RepID=UPI00355A2753|nr:hypothetical protein MONOS_11457 [Monocercomonoides exilis]|eukprot:MONOS_11457.1-p1 / transcript=MONOS_11457.1 / gene=MONOS_11457 / organism=Monocercomonoides_exilis_PA203 / gene_product=unspecified product / transcript_product=unspecified product / location=Mono_scaffold00576:33748-34526(-) / protein_length=199 / sequence_SO=supercontig / SO=protein_coding / is_pseudo=false